MGSLIILPWDTLSWFNCWTGLHLPYYGIENPIDIEKQDESGINFRVRNIGSTDHHVTCFPARIGGKPVEFPANCLQKIYFLTSFGYPDGDYKRVVWFNLYLHNNETKDLVCNIRIRITPDLTLSRNFIAMELWDCNKKYEVTSPAVLIGGSCMLHVKPRSSDIICRDFYTSDFLMMFGRNDNPFDKWDIRPVGKVGESKVTVDEQRMASICNVYVSSESGFLPIKTYYNAEELIAHFHNGWDFPYTWFHTFYTPVDSIPINNATWNFDNDESPLGSVLPGNSSSINTMYSWDHCKKTHFKADSDQCNYKWVHLFAYKYMPEIPPCLAYEIVNKNTGVVEGHLVLHLRMVDGKDGKRWWLDSVDGDFLGQKAEVKGGPGFLGIDNKPWCISFK